MTDVVVITGGSRGIGAACAKMAAEKGYHICFSYIANENAANALISEIEAAGGTANAVKGDVASRQDVAKLFAEAAKMGTITGFINNAGIVDQTARLDEMSVERLERMIAVNVLGALYGAQEAILHMSTKHGGKGGTIVNLSSAAAKLGSPAQYVDYAASKGAIDTLTLGLAKEVAEEGIRVNGIRPGIIDTDLHASGGEPDRVQQMRSAVPMKREGSAKEVADAILWLMSPQSSYVTGATLDVTGGR